MEKVTISTDTYSWTSLTVAHFSLPYDLEPRKVREELKGKLNEYNGAKGIEVERVQNRYKYLYKVVFPGQCIEGKRLTIDVVGGALEALEGEVREALRVKECLQMVKKGD